MASSTSSDQSSSESDSLADSSSSSSFEYDEQHHINSLKSLVDRKDYEIKEMMKIIEGLRDHLTKFDVKADSENKQDVGVDLNIIMDNISNSATDPKTKTVELTAELASKNIQIGMLTVKIIKLQNELFHQMNTNPQALKNLYASQRIQLKEAYTFSDWRTFNAFPRTLESGKILGSSISLDINNLVPQKTHGIEEFIKTFRNQIKHFRICLFRTTSDLRESTFSQLENLVDLWLPFLSNLESFTIVFSIGKRNLQCPNTANESKEIMKGKTFEVENFQNLTIESDIFKSFYIPIKEDRPYMYRTLREMSFKTNGFRVVTNKLISRAYVYRIKSD